MNTSLEIIRSAGTDHLCYRMEEDTFVAVHNPMLSFTERKTSLKSFRLTNPIGRNFTSIRAGCTTGSANLSQRLARPLSGTGRYGRALHDPDGQSGRIGCHRTARQGFHRHQQQSRRDGVSGVESPCHRYRLPERQRLDGVPDGTRQSAACLPALSGIVQSHQYPRVMFPTNKPNV